MSDVVKVDIRVTLSLCADDAFLLALVLSQTNMNLHQLTTLAVHEFIRRQNEAATL